MIRLVLEGDQCLWGMDGRWFFYYSIYWTNTQQENGLRFVFLHLCPRCRHTIEHGILALSG